MRVFRLDHADVIVAHDVNDAWNAWEEYSGGRREEEDWSDADMVELPPDQKLTISDINGDHSETRTIAEWAALNGGGFLCSPEW